jgi:hypothetical protein
MPLQSRVTPSGEFVANPARGLFMGNRGGRIHRDDRTLANRRYASKQWICCALDFKGRARKVWGSGYTELFFLDEVTALSAGHRPCFECRRAHALAFTDAWQRAFGYRPRAAAIDDILHAERLIGPVKRTHRRDIDDLPDATVIVREGAAFALRGDAVLRWSPAGYTERYARPVSEMVDVLPPPSIVGVLAAGYAPHWHPGAAG